MLRNVVIVLLVIVISLMLFKASDQNAGAQDTDAISKILENQQIIIEKLDAIDSKVNILKTRIR